MTTDKPTSVLSQIPRHSKLFRPHRRRRCKTEESQEAKEGGKTKQNLMMRQRLLSVVVLLACSLTMAFGQSKGDIIKYIEENKLYLNGKDVTVTSLKLEWPLKLDGDGMSPLQGYLCKAILDTEAEDFQSGWTAFHKKLGKEIKRMPDTATRHYVNAKLQMLWTVPNTTHRYILSVR